MDATDPTALSRQVVLWIYIWLGMQSLYGLFSGWIIWRYSGVAGEVDGGLFGGPDNDPAAMAGGVTALVYFIAFAVSGYLILRWIYRTNANAQLFSERMAISPGWNVGWFFVPIANLFKPFQGVRETWQVSHGAPDWEIVPVPPLLRWWWALWLATNILDNVSFRISMRDDDAATLVTSSTIDAASALLGIPLALSLVAIVRRLTSAQVAMLNREVFA